jgi:hypothetical protein
MPCPKNIIAIAVIVCICGFLLISRNKKNPFKQETIVPSNDNDNDVYVSDLDELINNIYFIQLHAK